MRNGENTMEYYIFVGSIFAMFT